MASLRQAVFALLLLLSAGSAFAQAPAVPAPAGLSPQQFDQLVDSITRAVTERLKQEQAAPATTPAPAAAPTPAAAPASAAPAAPEKAPAPAASAAPASAASDAAPMMMNMAQEEPFSEMFVEALSRSDDVLAEFPHLFGEVGRIPGVLRADINNGREPGRFLIILLACVFAMLAAEGLLRFALRPARNHLAHRVTGTSSIWALLALVGLDIMTLFGVWLVVHGMIVSLFGGTEPQSRLGFLVLTSLFSWRAYILAFRITLRPALPQARLAEIDDADAWRIYIWASAVLFVAIALNNVRRILEGIHSPPLIVACAVLVNAIIITSLLIAASAAMRGAVSNWLRGLNRDGQPRPIVSVLARHWLFIAVPFFLLLGIARAYDALSVAAGVQQAILMTMNVLLALLVLETFMDKVFRLMRRDIRPDNTRRELAIEALMRCARMAILLGALALLFRIWAVYGVGMMDMSGYNALASAALPAGAILFGAYCAWQAVEYFTAIHSSTKAAVAMPGQGDDDLGAPASRMSTLMPLLRVTLTLAIILMAGLTVLSQLGIDIMPLIAGASIIGLAISFGSQTLVKDIVSGVFYLVDDAFRVGEYIDCGRAKGTVEGFTLRSIRLRHQNGMIHTIPFGQLGQITNFSRDWATLKFNLRFTRDTDIEKLRKTVKKIGIEMQEDPEYKDDFLMPLKLQGVADIADNALIMRFKLTVKPNRPTVIQREAIKRMVRILPEQGLEFANNTVAVQSLGGPGDEGGAAAAINRARIANDIAEKAAAEAAAS